MSGGSLKEKETVTVPGKKGNDPKFSCLVPENSETKTSYGSFTVPGNKDPKTLI